jgi:glyoxylase-like metal-dependent hydrolase (beta-lactamase superfamily II)
MYKNPVKIAAARIGYSNVVLIKNGANSVLVDTGLKGRFKKVKTLLSQLQVEPGEVKLIVLTHVHYDHTGNLQRLKEYTGAKVLVHQNEYENLKSGFIPIPDGQGKYSRLISKFGKLVYPKYASPRAFEADLINEDEFDLSKYGIAGKVISTPGHTLGSQSVLLGPKLIAGDTFINLKNGKIFPPFCNEPKVLIHTWQNLFDLGIEEIYPGHGKPLKIGEVQPEFEKWKKRLL